MVDQGNQGILVRAIETAEFVQVVREASEEFQERSVELIERFVRSGPSPQTAYELENELREQLRSLGRVLMDQTFSRLEPDVERMPKTIEHEGETFRRLPEKTRRADVLTCFGKITLKRGRYRRGSRGRTIFPLEMLLGIENGFTPAAADKVGRQFAATGSSQGRTLQMIEDSTGERIGAKKLRNLVGTLAEELEPFRERAQADKLISLIEEARCGNNHSPILSVSRDGVALGMAPWSFFEMAGVATVSVLAGGRRLGTVYLGCAPETNQESLSAHLTSLLTAVVRRLGDDLPEVVYVTDAGKIETAYWKNTLRKFYVDGRRIKVRRVVDYYHAAEKLTKIADALRVDDAKRQQWLERVRSLLLEPGGCGRVLRSIAKMRKLYGYKRSHADDAKKAEKYLRRYRRFMNYAELKSQNHPIGSGVVESACKQVVSERMKLSGMRWRPDGGRRTIRLRCLLLSGVWDRVYTAWLQAKSTVSNLLQPQTA